MRVRPSVQELAHSLHPSGSPAIGFVRPARSPLLPGGPPLVRASRACWRPALSALRPAGSSHHGVAVRPVAPVRSSAVRPVDHPRDASPHSPHGGGLALAEREDRPLRLLNPSRLVSSLALAVTAPASLGRWRSVGRLVVPAALVDLASVPFRAAAARPRAAASPAATAAGRFAPCSAAVALTPPDVSRAHPVFPTPRLLSSLVLLRASRSARSRTGSSPCRARDRTGWRGHVLRHLRLHRRRLRADQTQPGFAGTLPPRATTPAAPSARSASHRAMRAASACPLKGPLQLRPPAYLFRSC